MSAVDAFRARRERLLDAMLARGGGVAVLPTAPERLRNGDNDYPYRHDSRFYYLTGFVEPQAWLVLIADARAGRRESILFCRARDEQREIWDGFRHGPEAACAAFAMDAAYPVDDLDERMPRLIANAPALFYALGQRAVEAQMDQWRAALRPQARRGVRAPASAFDLQPLVDEMRLVKDASEIATLRRAAQLAAAAHLRAMQKCRPGWHEYELEAELLHEFHRHGAAPAYNAIVAAGANTCVLHYRAGRVALQDGALCLIDAGCEFDSYASDVTRTFPVNGRFSGEQRAVYEIVLAAQQAALDRTAPGAPWNAPDDAAIRVLTLGMRDLGLLAGSVDGAIESGAYKQFYMHRTGHWLGLDVHDAGDYRDPTAQADMTAADTGDTADAAATRAVRPYRLLVPGMVLTVEPGMYLRPAPNVPARFENIGVRIEDDVLVTASGHEVLSSDAPKTVADIEAVMRQ
ncbi:MAG TPA: aminopeptidase P N-terminal domain-containing protein [Burkholderiaceae bacterium]|nr:aminopeptidase P N-terminal domain-containing protein [Burkholderiaceae bacterium]